MQPLLINYSLPPSQPGCTGGEQTLAIRTKVDLYVKELLVKLPGLFVVCEYCTVSVWIYILSDTNGPMVISPLCLLAPP